MTRQPDAPRHVVASGADAESVVRRLARDGWTVREGFALPDPAWDVTAARLILHGRVADRENLQLAVLAAARGAGIVAVCNADTPVGRALVDDLSRLGAVRSQGCSTVFGLGIAMLPTAPAALSAFQRTPACW